MSQSKTDRQNQNKIAPEQVQSCALPSVNRAAIVVHPEKQKPPSSLLTWHARSLAEPNDSASETARSSPIAFARFPDSLASPRHQQIAASLVRSAALTSVQAARCRRVVPHTPHIAPAWTGVRAADQPRRGRYATYHDRRYRPPPPRPGRRVGRVYMVSRRIPLHTALGASIYILHIFHAKSEARARATSSGETSQCTADIT